MLIIYKKGCYYSQLALKELQKRKIKYVKMVVSDHSGGTAKSSYTKVKKLIKHDTFPVIYAANGKKIGGYDKLVLYLNTQN